MDHPSNVRVLTSTNEERMRIAAFFTDGSPRVAAGLIDGSVDVFDYRTGRQVLHIRQAHEHNEVNIVIPTRDGRHLVTGGDDGFIAIFDAANGKLETRINLWGSRVYSLALSGDETTLAACYWNGRVTILGFPSLNILQNLETHQNVVMGVAINADANVVATASWDKTCEVWRAEEGTREYVRRAQFYFHCDCNSVDLSSNGQFCATGDDNGVISLFDAEVGVMLVQFNDHQDKVVSISMASFPNVLLVASASWDRTVRLRQIFYSVDEKGIINIEALPSQVVARHDMKVINVRFDASGTRLVSASHDTKACVVDLFYEDKERILALASTGCLMDDLLVNVRRMLFV